MTLQPNDLVRVRSGVHAGRDGKLLSVAHGVCEIQSWLDREEILICFESDVEPLVACPPEHQASARRALAAEMRKAAAALELLRAGCNEVQDWDAARRVQRMGQDLCSMAGRMGAR